ncbi:ABC transporter substrate-binding protein [Novosphingobium sp. 9]|uniref:ABC transporter substrate-binding protein n=1 Tax=Novosphingobium sp. 9 TaxID=2025349 RepID=UPI0021B53813|nr:ABC transporter substrate-binding protein [Novosphingobium sp. 9]
MTSLIGETRQILTAPHSRRAVLAGGSALLAAGLTGCGHTLESPNSILIANASGGLTMVMTQLMKQERFLEHFGLDADLMNIADGSRILGGIVGESLDCSLMSGFGQAFPAMERGSDMKIIGGGILLPALAMFSGKPNVQSLKDLEGKAIGTGSIGALVYQLTVTLLRKYGVDTSKIRFVNIGSSPDVFRAVSAGTVDAGLAQTALIDTADEYHVHALPHGNLSEELPLYTYQGAWTSAKTIKERRETIVRAMAAYARMFRFVQEPANKAAFIRARRKAFSSASQADHEAEWHFIQTYKPFATDLVIGPDRIEYIQKLNMAFGQQKSIVPFEQATDMSLARDAIALLERHS